MNCPDCRTPLKFRRWSNRLPAKSEALGQCPTCGNKFQIRYRQGKPTSRVYRVRKPAKKTARGSSRIPPERKAAITALFGSVTEFLQTANLLACMSQQYKS